MKVEKTMAAAREREYPLLCTMEEARQTKNQKPKTKNYKPETRNQKVARRLLLVFGF
jgi:hypothetical protein